LIAGAETSRGKNIPVNIGTMNFNRYEDFFLDRRKLMVAKIKTYLLFAVI